MQATNEYSADSPHDIYTTTIGVFDPRTGHGHHYILRWNAATRLAAIDTLLRWAFDRQQPMTPNVAAMVTKKLATDGVASLEEIGQCWRRAHEAHLRECEREAGEIARDAREIDHYHEHHEQHAEARSRGAVPTNGRPSADSGQGSAGSEAPARWNRGRDFLSLLGQGIAVGAAIAWLVHWLGL